MHDFQQCTMFLQKWILNPQDLPQNRSLETIPVCIVLQYYPHYNIVCIHMYDECKKSSDSGVCHRLWSIVWWILQVCSLNIEYQVLQFVPRKTFVNILRVHLWQFSNRFSFLLLWSGGQRCMEQILKRVVVSSCLLTHNIAPLISLHDPPYHKTMKITKILTEYGSFSVLPAEIRDSNMVL